MTQLSLSYQTLPLGSDLGEESRILSIAFGVPAEKSCEWIERSGRSIFRTVTSGDSIAALVMIIPMGIYFGGQSIPMSGIAGVAVAPDFRGQGVARWMMTQAMRELARDGVPLSGLYSAMHPLYRSVGFEQAGTRFHITVPLHLLPTGSRTFEELAPGSTDLVRPCYNAWASRCDGHLDRGPYVWARIENWRGTPMRGFVSRNARGEIDAYVYLHQQGSPDPCVPQSILVTDMGAATPESLRSLMSFLAGFSSIASSVSFYGGPTHPLLTALDDRRYKVELTDHWMLRVVDVQRAFEHRGFSRGLSARMRFNLVDTVFPEQEGAWSLEVSEGRARATHTGAPESGAPKITARGLASLFAGHLSAHSLRLTGLLDATPDQLDALHAVFPPTNSSMVDMF